LAFLSFALLMRYAVGKVQNHVHNRELYHRD
jgi:hypothetical protein